MGPPVHVVGCAAYGLNVSTRAHGGLDIMAKAAKKKSRPQKLPNLDAVARISANAAALRSQREKKPPTPSNIKRCIELETAFLEGLASGHSVTTSAWAIGISRITAYDWRNKSEATRQEDGSYTDDFCVRWDDAIQAGIESLEDEAHRRARDGVEKPVYQGGVMVGTVTEYSDQLMQFLLKGRAPRKFADRQELTGKDGGPVVSSIQVEFVQHEGKK